MASARKPVELDNDGWALLTSILFRIACSAPWAWDLRREIAAGTLPYRPGRASAQARALQAVGAYPPGGESSLMRVCATCRKSVPPQCMGSSRQCYECYINGLSIWAMVKLPSSPGSRMSISHSEAMAAGLSLRKRRQRELEDPEACERVKFLDVDGRVVELAQGEDGFFYEVVPPAPTKAAEPGSEAA